MNVREELIFKYKNWFSENAHQSLKSVRLAQLSSVPNVF